MLVTLDSITTKITKGTTPTSVGCTFENSGVNFIKSESLGNSRNIDRSKFAFISEQTHEKLKRSQIEKNDILFSMAGMFLGKTGIVTDDLVPANINQAVAIIRIDTEKANHEYVYYYLNQRSVVQAVNASSAQSAQPNINLKQIGQIEIDLPERKLQDKIVSILSAIDFKIEKNNQINENLEQQAKALYQQMFIENTCPDWIEGSLRDIADITMGQSPSGSSYNEDGIGTIFFQGRAEFSFRFPTIRLYTTEPKRMAYANDILMSVRAPVGDLNIAHTDCCIGRGLAAIHSKTNHQSFVLYTMFSLRKQLDVFNGEGTVFGSINRNSLNDMPILIPSDETIEEFEKIVAPMDAAIRNNYDEICRLQAVRDSLLPRLMSGELDVSSLDI